MSERDQEFSVPAILGIAGVLVLGGCSALTPGPTGKLFERHGVSMVIVPADSRETYFNDPGSAERHCRAPSSDVSVTASEGISLANPVSAVAGIGGRAVSESAGIGAVALGGRNPAVLITRELMYRACELTSNLDLPFDKTIQVYERFLQAIEKIAGTRTGTGTAGIATAPPTVFDALPSVAGGPGSVAGGSGNPVAGSW